MNSHLIDGGWCFRTLYTPTSAFTQGSRARAIILIYFWKLRDTTSVKYSENLLFFFSFVFFDSLHFQDLK